MEQLGTPDRSPAKARRPADRGRRGARGLALIWLVGWWAGALASEQRGALAATDWAFALEQETLELEEEQPRAQGPSLPRTETSPGAHHGAYRGAYQGTNSGTNSGTSPRILRRAAGVGPRRSVDLARYLWCEGPDADLEGLASIGPRTAEAVREVLAGGDL